jgi:hypothetical protein
MTTRKPAKEVNWRSYVDKYGSNLTDRQTKLLDKIQKLLRPPFGWYHCQMLKPAAYDRAQSSNPDDVPVLIFFTMLASPPNNASMNRSIEP